MKKKIKMETKKNKVVWTATAAQDQLKFCAAYLFRHGIDTGNKFIRLLDVLTPDDPEFAFVKINIKTEMFEEMAARLKDLWPAGMKRSQGHEYPWRGSITNLSVRLKQMWNMRKFADKNFTIDDVLSCGRRYLSQFEENTKYMQTLPYFILKKDTDSIGKVLYKSRLADMLEGNMEEEAVSNESLEEIFDDIEHQGRIV